MRISMILAMDENQGIGINNKLPWRLQEDMKRFRRLTMGHHLVMGRKTFESIGKPLTGRENVILTRNLEYHSEDCFIVHTPEEGLVLAEERGEEEIFIIGGADIYSEFLPKTDRIYLTLVHTIVEADTFFPKFETEEWTELASVYHPSDEENDYPTTFKVLERS